VDYEFDDDPARVDRDAVWTFLSTEAYWGQWRTREIVDGQITGAWRVVGAYTGDGAMVGFVRAVSDGVSLAYVADVFVNPAHRGHGVGTGLLRRLIEDGPGAHLRWMLHTADAHGLYAKFGFGAPDEKYMERPAMSNQRGGSLTAGSDPAS
jgi:GNAT superfamily N-acetyltransferase